MRRSFSDATFGPLGFRQFGDRTDAYRLKIHFKSRERTGLGSEGDFFFDLVWVANERVGFSIQGADALMPFDTEELEDIVAKALTKVEDLSSESRTTRATTSPADGAGSPVELELVAENTSYDPTELMAPAGVEVTVVFDNDDPDIQHNFALFESEDALDDPIFTGETITGVDTTDYVFTAPQEPGTYFYHCDIHPTAMTGDFIGDFIVE
jgi:plastocyanin